MTAQLDLFEFLEPIASQEPKPDPVRAQAPKTRSVFARVVIAAREQSPHLWGIGFKPRPYGGMHDRVTDPAVPSQHDDWPTLFYAHCHIRSRGLPATLNGGYQDRKFQ
ncbi:MAG: hypothetical protein A2486_07090 [Burkholderiales bacterium RIFOXYC12_FULL_65_23]|nr:MAG: hypothetical protein A2486_07090 [Burkholderiales bacterium RIFOXYC12_FULL_65_23]